MNLIALAVVASLAAGGAAQAQTQVTAAAALNQAVRPAADATAPKTVVGGRYADPAVQRIPGVAKTAVDHRFSESDLTGSMGFMCGLNPGAQLYGAAGARGYDPNGRFVGARLSLAFR